MRLFSKSYDVIVCGGGPAGVAAAVSAARQGAKTALIERYGILGGMMTSGHVNPILGSVSPGTIYDELMVRLGAHSQKTYIGYERSIDPENAKGALLHFAAETGVDVFLQTSVAEVRKDGTCVVGVVICTQNGLETLTADVVIDATGDGFVAARAGAEFQIGREPDRRCQPASLEFTIDHVDEARGLICGGTRDSVTLPGGQRYADFCKEKHAAGELPQNVTIVRLHHTAASGERSVNATQVNGLDTLTAEGIFEAERDLRDQIASIITFLRRYIPGYENCRLKSTGSTLGVRETRRITGDYILSDHDVESGVKQADVVVHNAWFLIDIHNPNGGGQSEGYSHPALPYDIPYRCLLPKGLDGILTCGRCISGTHRAHASYRVMGICMATGQAAGIAAALSAKAGVQPRELDVRTLQSTLRQTGAVLFDAGEDAP